MRRLGSEPVAEAHRVPADPVPPRSVGFAVHELGEGRLEAGPPNGRVQKVLRIDVTDAPANLLGRLLVGSYITGQDQVLLTARGGLTVPQRQEVRRVVDRIIGMSVVGDTPSAVEVQNFLDPGKHTVPRLLHRVVQMLETELEVCHAALSENGAPQFALIESLEDEVDRFYLLMVRQLLLSSDSPRIARNIDVESHHYQIGDRLVAKVLEVIGDLIHGIGAEMQENLTGLRRLPPRATRLLLRRIEQLQLELARTMDAFGRLSIVDANAALNEIGELLAKEAPLGRLIARHATGRKEVVATQRIACHLEQAFEMLVIVNEVTINRSVEPEVVALTGTRIAVGARVTAPASPPSPVARNAPVRAPLGVARAVT
jgi:phosphate uptake regulator